MKKFYLVSLLFFALAILCFAYAVYKGEVQSGIFVIFPFLLGSGVFSLLGTVFLILGIFSVILGIMASAGGFSAFPDDATPEQLSTRKIDGSVDGIVLIGPFPVIFTTKKSHILYLVIIAIGLVVGLLLLFFFLAFLV